ncbi:hypothetical protein PG997_002399 [Apiospora hydei]|uniref:Transcription factor domain-containing protein n=1 Tax=Apiospora hydei TaxID=1337664 RepID=A0ABR1X9B5_9PEZI
MTIHRDHRDHQQKSVQAVEDRVAELESILRREGISNTRSKRKRHTENGEFTTVLTPVESVESPTVIQWKPSPAPSDSRSDIASQSLSHQSRVATGTVMDILGDLSIEAPGAFFGSSSQITMNRVIASIIQARKERVDAPKKPAWQQLSPDSETSVSTSDNAARFPQISAGVAQRLFDCYLSHFATCWPILQTSFIHLLHTERDNLSDVFFTSVLHLVYAIAGRYLEAAGETGTFFPNQHLAAAMKNIDEIIRLHGIRSIQFLLLLSIYSLNIDEETEHFEMLQTTYEASELPGSRILPQAPSMTGFIHVCKLRVMESHIQQSIYRVDQPTTLTEMEVEGFLEKLEGWKSRIPVDFNSPSHMTAGVEYNTYMLYYYKSLHYLLRPFLLLGEFQTKFVRRCTDACGGVCRTYKKLHQAMPIGFSFIDLVSVFSAGMALIYCVWTSPKDVLGINSSNDMNACSIVLYIITERLPVARKYRDIFETVKMMVSESIEENQYEARRPIAKLRSFIQAALPELDSDQDEEGKLSAMMSDMTGEPAPRSESASTSSAPTECNNSGSIASAQPNQSLPLDGIPLDFEQADAYNAMDLQLGTIFAAPGIEWTAKT